MATSQIASMLDELMGRNRNLAPDDAANKELKWSDPDVCRYKNHICLILRIVFFTNAKIKAADMGPR